MTALPGMLLAALGVAALLVGVRRRVPGWVLLALGCAPTLVLLRDWLRLYSFHGFMHASIVYRVLNTGLPPTDPLVGGHPLRYPWAHHALLAPVVRALDVTPPVVFAVFNVLALAATLLVLYRVARALTTGRSARLLGVALAVFGVSPIVSGPLGAWVPEPGVARIGAIFPVAKYLHVNNNQAGFLCYAAFLLLLVKLLAQPARARLPLAAGVAATVLAAALLYPFVWVPAVAVGGGCAASVLAIRGRSALRAALLAAGAVATGSLLALPYLLMLQQDRPEPALALALDPGHLRYTALSVLLTVVPIALLALLPRDRWAPALRRHRDAWLCLGIAAALPTAIFLVSHARDHAEHKLLSLTTLAVGLLAGAPLAALRRMRPWAAGLVLIAATFPAFDHVARLATQRGPDPTRYRSAGSALEPADPAERGLMRWLRENTPPDAVVLDTHSDVPVCAQRALYVPVATPEVQRDRTLPPGWRPGLPWIARLSFGHPMERIAARTRHLQRVLAPGGARPPDALLHEIREGARTSAVYVVARRAGTRQRLATDPRFLGVYERWTLALFRLEPPPAASAGDAPRPHGLGGPGPPGTPQGPAAGVR